MSNTNEAALAYLERLIARHYSGFVVFKLTEGEIVHLPVNNNFKLDELITTKQQLATNMRGEYDAINNLQ